MDRKKGDRVQDKIVNVNFDLIQTSELRICGNEYNYYAYDGELYTLSFPLNWATDPLPNTGPKNCTECKLYGSWNGVFIGYCGDCAEKYNFKRGNGFIETGIERNSVEPTSARNTYLKYIHPDKIGDIDTYDSKLMFERDLFDSFIEFDMNVRKVYNNIVCTHLGNIKNILFTVFTICTQTLRIVLCR